MHNNVKKRMCKQDVATFFVFFVFAVVGKIGAIKKTIKDTFIALEVSKNASIYNIDTEKIWNAFNSLKK